jgi:hypothetical protein
MQFHFGAGIRHPFLPGLRATPAREAKPLNPALYGTFRELERAAAAGARVRRAVFVTCEENEPVPGDSEHDALWEMFQVPAFAMLLDAKGHVLAFECEAQSGLHVSAGGAAASDDTAICECGRPGRKLHPCSAADGVRKVDPLTIS